MTETPNQGPCQKCGYEYEGHMRLARRGMCPPSPRNGSAGLRVLVAIVLAVVFLGGAMSFLDPHLNFPLVSQTVCSLKGDTWYGGGLLGSPGCYAP